MCKYASPCVDERTMNTLQQLWEKSFDSDDLIKLVLADKRKKSQLCSRVTVRPVQLDGTRRYQFTFQLEKKVIHENLTATEAAVRCHGLLCTTFKQLNAVFTDTEVQVLAAKPEKPRITCKTTACRPPAALAHNHAKRYILPEDQPCAFLQRLGVMDETGRVVKKHYDKFRQINRYLEIIADVYPTLIAAVPADRPLRIIDFGCGKAYLTFAIYHYLHEIRQQQVEIIGLDLKQDVIDFCQQIATDLHAEGLHFRIGDIADYTNDYADMVVTLHACDTATDYALINAVSWHAPVILSVPCCQHELFSQMQNDLHQPILKYGILRDRLTEYLTDGLRALKLEASGYDVAMIEFTSLQHTARNIMLKAVKPAVCPNTKTQQAQQQYEALCAFYHVHPTIDKLPALGQEPTVTPSSASLPKAAR